MVRSNLLISLVCLVAAGLWFYHVVGWTFLYMRMTVSKLLGIYPDATNDQHDQMIEAVQSPFNEFPGSLLLAPSVLFLVISVWSLVVAIKTYNRVRADQSASAEVGE